MVLTWDRQEENKTMTAERGWAAQGKEQFIYKLPPSSRYR